MEERCTVSGKLSGTVEAPSSKSDLHRLLLAAALCFGQRCRILGYQANDDIGATASILEAAGACITQEAQGLVLEGFGTLKQDFVADCRESGSTLRFLLPVLGALGLRCSFVGRGRLPQRPLTPLVEELRAHGLILSGDSLPLAISGQLQPGNYTFPGNISSQYITGLLFALPLLPGDSDLRLSSPLESKGYVELTLSVLRRFGIQVEQPSELCYHIPGGQLYRSPGELRAQGDWSGAAFWLVAGALSGPLTVTGLQQDSLQGDRAVCEILSAMGAKISWATGAVTVSPAPLRAVDIDASQIPDLVPPLVVAAAFARGESRIYNAGRLRLKESDRLSAVAKDLGALGASVEEGPDHLLIRGSEKLRGGVAESFGDHRLAMAMAIASLGCKEPVTILDPGCVKKSYPAFYQDFEQLGGVVHGFHLD